ncbi:hypothetical protein BU16DRAFT_566817 [Lophium mytilinum]|uniref:Uncharacterized protein n=1 Tax=Lophium mytilinum TaxID=390894 RepID=A0A6A6QE11_9PEZI|nr:hypothetical protein BU16DRAFT_566817 [Lophium mytilinum]
MTPKASNPPTTSHTLRAAAPAWSPAPTLAALPLQHALPLQGCGFPEFQLQGHIYTPSGADYPVAEEAEAQTLVRRLRVENAYLECRFLAMQADHDTELARLDEQIDAMSAELKDNEDLIEWLKEMAAKDHKKSIRLEHRSKSLEKDQVSMEEQDELIDWFKEMAGKDHKKILRLEDKMKRLEKSQVALKEEQESAFTATFEEYLSQHDLDVVKKPAAKDKEMLELTANVGELHKRTAVQSRWRMTTPLNQQEAILSLIQKDILERATEIQEAASDQMLWIENVIYRISRMEAEDNGLELEVERAEAQAWYDEVTIKYWELENIIMMASEDTKVVADAEALGAKDDEICKLQGQLSTIREEANDGYVKELSYLKNELEQEKSRRQKVEERERKLLTSQEKLRAQLVDERANNQARQRNAPQPFQAGQRPNATPEVHEDAEDTREDGEEVTADAEKKRGRWAEKAAETRGRRKR